MGSRISSPSVLSQELPLKGRPAPGWLHGRSWECAKAPMPTQPRPEGGPGACASHKPRKRSDARPDLRTIPLVQPTSLANRIHLLLTQPREESSATSRQPTDVLCPAP